VCVRDPWRWVLDKVKTDSVEEVGAPTDLPTARRVAAAAAEAAEVAAAAAASSSAAAGGDTPMTRRRRQQSVRNKDRTNGPSTLKIEVSDLRTGDVAFAVHGTSSALDGLEDKDELVRTIQRCRCEHLNISPPSILISWDVTREECLNVVGDAQPKLDSNTQDQVYGVLKEPMGSQGKGIYFVRDAEEIHQVISEHRQQAQKDPAFLDNLIQAKGRIPSWGEYFFYTCITVSANELLTNPSPLLFARREQSCRRRSCPSC